MRTEQFLTMSPTKLFFRCAIPAVITSVFGALYSMVDGFFVGRYIGEDALAAINLIMPIIMIVEAIANMIATGASVNISILLGEKKQEEASRMFSFSVKFIILLSCVLGIGGYFGAESFVGLIAPGAGEKAVEMSVQYLKIYALFAPLIPIYFAMDNYLRVCGRERLSMIIGVASQGLNVLLDYYLIVVLRMGVRSAAIASCVSIALASVIMLALFLRKKMDIYYTSPKLDAKSFLHILANGSSELFSNIAASIMSVVMNLFLLKYGGTTAVAAFSIVMYVDQVIGMLSFGMCDSLQPAISYCYGAGQMDRMKEIFKRVLYATVITSLAAFVLMLFAGPDLAKVFITPGDIELTDMSAEAIRIFAFSYIVGWIDVCFSSLFTAVDKPGRSLIIAVFGTVVFPIVSLFILTGICGLTGVWLMAPVAALASGILTMVLVKTVKL